jgi:hypothetical protein
MESFCLSEISNYNRLNSRDITFVGIGTTPRITNLDQFTDRIDQIIPLFIKNIKEKTIRLIHFDSVFERCIDFLHVYFQSKNFTYDNQEMMHIWRSADHKIEVIINTFYFCYDEHKFFLNELIETCFTNPNKHAKFILQDFTGTDSSIMFTQLYNETSIPQKNMFREKILFDISYGNNHCDLDLIKYEPIYDPNGDFINILLMDINELRIYLDYHPLIKEHVQKFYIQKYRSIADVIPVDIRRKMLRESGKSSLDLISYDNLYTVNSSYEDIMKIFNANLMPIIEIFREINFMNPEKEFIINEIMTNYKDYTLYSTPSIYDWSTLFVKIVK